MVALLALAVTFLSPKPMARAAMSTSFTKVLGMTLCLCLAALAMDLVWGYCGILSLGHFAFFGLGGYMIGMWLMTARTEAVIRANLAESPIPPTRAEVSDATALQIFSVVGAEDWPWMWAFSDSLFLSLVLSSWCPACWRWSSAGSPSAAG
jgi:urea transport system permease protein